MSASELSPALEEATADQPAVRAALAAALGRGPAHAYALIGPRGSGKRAVARAFAAELLARGARDPDDARRRALADPSPHPDLAWLTPPGTQHLVDEVRSRVIAAAAYRPFEGERRVFVVEAAEAMADESQNALLKTLEEPPAYAHLILISAEPAALLETVRSRCQEIRFAPLPSEAVERRLAADGADAPPELLAAAARLAAGDLDHARLLLSERGAALREAAIACARAAGRGGIAGRPWAALLEIAAETGKGAAAEAQAAAEARAAELGRGRDADRVRRLGAEAARRAERARRTEAIDLGLAIAGAWFLDLVAVGSGAEETLRHVDRRRELAEDAEGLEPRLALEAAQLTLDARRRLEVNVSEELALEATFHRAARRLAA